MSFPDGPAVDAELARLRIVDNERERVHKQKLKGILPLFLPRYLTPSRLYFFHRFLEQG